MNRKEASFILANIDRRVCDDELNEALDVAIKALDQEPKTGHWIFVDKAHEHAHCSECDYGDVDLLDGRPHNYCPNCGCRMVEPQERSDKE